MFETKIKNYIAIIYFFGALVLSLIIELVIKNYIQYSIEADLLGVIITAAIYILAWILPAYIIINKKKNGFFDYLKLKSNSGKGVVKGCIYSAFIIIFYIIKLILFKGVSLKLNMTLYVIVSGVLVGILEEIPFRGFILNELKNNLGFWKANIVTSILFTIAHVPNWGINASALFIFMYSTFVISLFLGYLFNKTGSLWTTIIMHSVYNLCFFIMV